MKANKRIVAALVFVILTASLTSMAFANASEIFFSGPYLGYQCTGKGIIAGYVATANFTAEPIPFEPIFSDALYLAAVDLYVYDEDGTWIYTELAKGTTNTTASYDAEPIAISRIKCGFTILDVDLGEFTLYNN